MATEPHEREREPYRPREHDHVVEPMFAGLAGGAAPRDRGRTALAIAAAVVVAAVAVRAWMVFAR